MHGHKDEGVRGCGGERAGGATCDVLLVEDEPIIRAQLAEILEQEGLSVCTATQGAEALSLLADLRPRLAVVDLMMPVMSGWELIGVMRKLPALAEIPTLVMTAASNVHLAPNGPVFLKPLNVDSLLRAVRGHLARDRRDRRSDDGAPPRGD